MHIFLAEKWRGRQTQRICSFRRHVSISNQNKNLERFRLWQDFVFRSYEKTNTLIVKESSRKISFERKSAKQHQTDHSFLKNQFKISETQQQKTCLINKEIKPTTNVNPPRNRKNQEEILKPWVKIVRSTKTELIKDKTLTSQPF